MPDNVSLTRPETRSENLKHLFDNKSYSSLMPVVPLNRLQNSALELGTGDLTTEKDKAILSYVNELSTAAGLSKPPKVYLATNNDASPANALRVAVGIGISDSDEYAVLISKQSRNAPLSSSEGLLAHEISHIANGDLSDERIKSYKALIDSNDWDGFKRMSISLEKAADDHTAKAPMCKGDALAKALLAISDTDMSKFLIANTQATPEDYYKKAEKIDVLHPPLRGRISEAISVTSEDVQCQKNLPPKKEPTPSGIVH